jgi:hypothetical protein
VGAKMFATAPKLKNRRSPWSTPLCGAFRLRLSGQKRRAASHSKRFAKPEAREWMQNTSNVL